MSPTATKFTTPHLDPDYEAPGEREIRMTREEIGHYLNRANDPTFLAADRRRFLQRAQAAHARLRALLNPPAPTDEDEDDDQLGSSGSAA